MVIPETLDAIVGELADGEDDSPFRPPCPRCRRTVVVPRELAGSPPPCRHCGADVPRQGAGGGASEHRIRRRAGRAGDVPALLLDEATCLLPAQEDAPVGATPGASLGATRAAGPASLIRRPRPGVSPTGRGGLLAARLVGLFLVAGLGPLASPAARAYLRGLFAATPPSPLAGRWVTSQALPGRPALSAFGSMRLEPGGGFAYRAHVPDAADVRAAGRWALEGGRLRLSVEQSNRPALVGRELPWLVTRVDDSTLALRVKEGDEQWVRGAD